PRAAFWSGNTASTASPSMSGYLRSRWRISITCGNGRAIGNAVCTTSRRDPPPWPSASGERRCPDPQGQPGYLRVDTVHQGDAPAGQGVYHINAVDQVTQWEIVAATERISEAWLEPVLCAMIRQFPFRILGFHSDHGSEFINRIVARLLNKLLIEQTKSRPRHSNDNGLVETKNGAVIRKHMGYGY